MGGVIETFSDLYLTPHGGLVLAESELGAVFGIELEAQSAGAAAPAAATAAPAREPRKPRKKAVPAPRAGKSKRKAGKRRTAQP